MISILNTAGPFGPEYETRYITFLNGLLDIPTIPEYARVLHRTEYKKSRKEGFRTLICTNKH